MIKNPVNDRIQRVDKMSTRWQSSKKEVIFCQIEFVGVRGYGRVQFGRKQATARETRCFSCGFLCVKLQNLIDLPLTYFLFCLR